MTGGPLLSPGSTYTRPKHSSAVAEVREPNGVPGTVCAVDTARWMGAPRHGMQFRRLLRPDRTGATRGSSPHRDSGDNQRASAVSRRSVLPAGRAHRPVAPPADTAGGAVVPTHTRRRDGGAETGDSTGPAREIRLAVSDFESDGLPFELGEGDQGSTCRARHLHRRARRQASIARVGSWVDARAGDR
jgi:hypothetical protein